MPGRLRLGEDAGGKRYFLDGEPIHAGTGLELLMPDGKWLVGRFEWDYRTDSRPLFYVHLGGEWEAHPEPEPTEDGGERYWMPIDAPMALPEQATLQWPREPR